MIALGELLARRELGLRLATVPDAAQEAQVLSAEVCDLPDPRPWLEAGAMLLTTGIGVGHSAHAQRLMVDRAAQAGVAAIGFGIGLAHSALPPTIVERCEQLRVPLVEVPPGTPFRLLVAAVAERTAPHQLQTAQRGLSMQSYLMEALSAPEPEAELLRRLGSLLGGTALLAGETGEIEGGPMSAVPEELWGPLRGGKGVALHHVRGRRYVTAPVSDRPGARRWLVVVGEASALPDQLARQALQSAERLVRLVDRTRPPRQAEARAIRAELADRLLGLRPAGERRTLALRAAALGLGVDDGLQVAVVRGIRGSDTTETRAQEAARLQVELEVALTAAELPFLLTHEQGDVLLIARAPLGAALDALIAAGGGDTLTAVDAGIGRETVGLDGLARSLRDARFALAQLGREARRAGDGSRLLAHADLDLATALACDADDAVAGPRVDALLGRIIGPDLRETLRAYLAHDLDVPRTAAALHLHANSLRYRLGRIEEQLGRSLRDPATIANLYLATLLQHGEER